MKFLIFNIVVAAALVFLFVGDKGDLTAIAQKAEQAVASIKSSATEAIEPKTAKPPPEKPAPVPQVQPVAAAAAVQSAEPEPTKAAASPAKHAAQPIPSVDVADRTPTPPLPPEVAKRRTEVLDDGATVVSEGTAEKFMPADMRKRELMLLSEEMELFSAKAISR